MDPLNRSVPVGAILRSRPVGPLGDIEVTFVAMAIVCPLSDYGTMLVLRARAAPERGEVVVLDGKLVRP